MSTDPSPTAPSGRARPLVRLLRRLGPIRWPAAGAYGAVLVASGIALVVPPEVRPAHETPLDQVPRLSYTKLRSGIEQ